MIRLQNGMSTPRRRLVNVTQANKALRSHFTGAKTAKIDGDVQILPRLGLALSRKEEEV